MYLERPSRIPGAVVWCADHEGPVRVLPDGCMDLLWLDEQLGVPARSLRDARVPLVDVVDRAAHWVPAVRPDSDPIAAADPLAAFELQLASTSAARTSGHDLVGLIAGSASVADVAASSGYSSRQLHRRCLDSFGYGPSVLRRILRFDSAVAEHRRGRSATWIAARHGYSDASHLHRDVRELAGVPLSQIS